MKAVSSSKINGSIMAPASKSVMIRAVAASYLASGISRIENPSFCTDSLVALKIADVLGADIHTEKDHVNIRGISGFNMRSFSNNIIQCGESGLCMRMFTPIIGLNNHRFIVEGSGSLLTRPMKMFETLSLMGGTCTTQGGYPPVTIEGPIRGGAITVDRLGELAIPDGFTHGFAALRGRFHHRCNKPEKQTLCGDDHRSPEFLRHNDPSR